MRIFIAVDLPEEIKDRIYSEVVPKIRFVRGKFVEKENLHVTLKFLGELTPDKVEYLKDLLSDVGFQSFRIRIKGIGVFPNPNFIRVVWLGVSEGEENLINLQREIDIRCKKLGFPMEKDFVPHITLLRVKQIYNREKFLEILNELKNIDIGSFEVKEFKIKRSILRPEGPLYLDIHAIPLNIT